MKIAIAGSRKLPKGQAPRLLTRLLAQLEDGTLVMLRRPITDRRSLSQFELDVAALCELLWLEVEWRKPEVNAETHGRASVYVRDIDMVNEADLMVLFFTFDDAEDGYSGTFHLLDKCLDLGRPVHAYRVDDNGSVYRFGDYDPDHKFDELALAT